MNPELKRQIEERLSSEFSLKLDTDRKRWKKGTCPHCGKPTLWAWADKPWTVQCDRENKCEYTDTVKNLFPDLFESYSNRFKEALKTDPKAAAKAYLDEARGLNWLYCDAFTQEVFAYNNMSSATVRFKFLNGYWERLIDKPERFGDMKARFMPGLKFKGHAWHKSDIDFAKIKELWVVEGIFDALALGHNGITAISAMTAHNYPALTLEQVFKVNPKIELIIALDNDEVGQKSILSFIQKAREQGFKNVGAAITGFDSKKDWNDCHIAKKMTSNDITQYLYYGQLIAAKSAAAKACLIWHKYSSGSFHLEFQDKIYWFDFNWKTFADEHTTIMKQYLADNNKDDESELSEKEKTALKEKAFYRSNNLIQISNFIIKKLYFQRDIETDESYYYLALTLKANKSKHTIKDTFTGSQIATSSDFKKRALSIMGDARFTGKTYMLDAIFNATEGIKHVATIPYFGYCADHQAYIYPSFAVKNGQVYEVNSEDYFEFGRTNIKTTFRIKSFNPVQTFKCVWFDDYMSAFGMNGLVALIYWFGSLFAEQLRGFLGSYPFLEITGQAGSGKSTMLEFLWTLVGRDSYEGLNPTNSSHAGVMRNLSQVSNLPVALIESDSTDDNNKSKQKSFNFETLKSLFNGRAPRSTGKSTAGNHTDEEPFRAAIVIAQNQKIQASEAILSRLIYLHFEKSSHSTLGKKAADNIKKLECEEVSGFLVESIKNEKKVLEIYTNQFSKYFDILISNDKISTVRIAENHAQMLALLDALSEILPINNNLKDKALAHITNLAITREEDLYKDHPALEEFWDAFDFLESQGLFVNHAQDNENYIALNINQFMAVAAGHHQKTEDATTIKRLIEKSVRYKYVGYKTVASRHAAQMKSKSIKCFIFKKKG